MKNTSFILYLCLFGMIATLIGFISGISSLSTKINQSELKIISAELTDDPFLKHYGGKNGTNYLVLHINEFPGYSLKTPEEYFKENKLSFILLNLKSKQKVKIGLLKIDYKFLKTEEKPWGIIEGFSTSRRISFTQIYYLNVDGVNYLDINEINSENRDGTIMGIFGTGLFLLISTLGFVEVLKIRREDKAGNQKPLA